MSMPPLCPGAQCCNRCYDMSAYQYEYCFSNWKGVVVKYNMSTMRGRNMKKITRLWKKHDYHSIYVILKEKGYDYTIDNIEKDFGKIRSMDKFCYLIYLLSNDYSVENTLLVCDFLMYTDTFFYDIHPAIRMIVQRALELFPTERILLEWVVSIYENHPDSPFEETELIAFKERLNDLN